METGLNNLKEISGYETKALWLYSYHSFTVKLEKQCKNKVPSCDVLFPNEQKSI